MEAHVEIRHFHAPAASFGPAPPLSILRERIEFDFNRTSILQRRPPHAKMPIKARLGWLIWGKRP